MTDKNGQFSTASDWAAHKKNTNAGKSSEDGIWFGTSEPDDSKGALLYDAYEIEELSCESNKGMKLIPAFEVVEMCIRDRVLEDQINVEDIINDLNDISFQLFISHITEGFANDLIIGKTDKVKDGVNMNE